MLRPIKVNISEKKMTQIAEKILVEICRQDVEKKHE